MKVGDLVTIKQTNGPGTELNINKIGLVMYDMPPKEVEIELFAQDVDGKWFLEPWIYFKDQLEVISE